MDQQDQGEDRHEQQGAQFDQGLQADGLDQTAIMFGQVRASGAEQDGEPRQNPGQRQNSQPFSPRHRRARRQKGAGHRQGFQLQGDIGQGAQDGHDGDCGAQGLALAVA